MVENNFLAILCKYIFFEQINFLAKLKKIFWVNFSYFLKQIQMRRTPRSSALQAGIQIQQIVQQQNREEARERAHDRRRRQFVLRQQQMLDHFRERRRQELRAQQQQQLMDHIRQNMIAHPRLIPVRQRAPGMPPNPQIQAARIAQQQQPNPMPAQQQQPNPMPAQQQQQPPQQAGQQNPVPPQQQQPPLPTGPLTDREFEQMMHHNGIVIHASRRRDFMCHICFGRFRHYVAYNNCCHGACVLCFAANTAERRICQDCRADVYIDLQNRRNPEPRPHLHYRYIVALAEGEVEEEDDE